MIPPIYDLVIFDCDGVLVDSEMLSAGVLMGLLEEVGHPISFEVFREDFLGHSFASATKRLHQRTRRQLPDGFQALYLERLLSHFCSSLNPMPGVHEVLQSLAVPFCLASSSPPERLKVSLGRCGLAAFFGPHVFSATQVRNGKPASDLLLLAAAAMGKDPARTLVIEDTEAGIRAAQAAGMQVWHFAGGSHIKAGYRLGAEFISVPAVDDMPALRQRLAECGLCSPLQVVQTAAKE